MGNALLWRVDWNSRPLCARYQLVIVNTLDVPVHGGGEMGERRARWAVGTLPNGQCEVIGVWLQFVSACTSWGDFCDELAVRGVEHIRFVVDAYALASTAPEPSAPGARSTSSVQQLVGSRVQADGRSLAAAEIGPAAGGASDAGGGKALQRLRCIAARADEVNRKLYAKLTRVVRGHGRFASQEAATLFLEGALERLDGELGAYGVATRAPRSQTVGPVRVAELALAR